MGAMDRRGSPLKGRSARQSSALKGERAIGMVRDEKCRPLPTPLERRFATLQPFDTKASNRHFGIV